MHAKDPKRKDFIKNIHAYNMIFAITSLGGKINSSKNQGLGPNVFHMHGQNYHMMGSLLPACGNEPKFVQLYIYDTEHEVSNKIRAIK